MRHLAKTSRLGVKTGHRVAMLRNLALGLIEHGRIRTTVARARRLRPWMEKLVTRLKDPSVANLRLAHQELGHKTAVHDLANKIAPKFSSRPGGYLRILKLAAHRPGDCADMALIEWVEDSLVGAYSDAKTEPKKKGAAAKKASAKGGSKPAKTEASEKADKPAKKAKAAKSK